MARVNTLFKYRKRFTQEGSYHFREGLCLFLPLRFNVLMQGMELKFGEAPKRRWHMVAGHLCISYFPIKTEWKSLSLKFKCNYNLPLKVWHIWQPNWGKTYIKYHSDIKELYRHTLFNKGSCCCYSYLVYLQYCVTFVLRHRRFTLSLHFYFIFQ